MNLNNNTDLNSFTSYYEFVYSFRKNQDTIFPGFDSNEAVEAFKKLKEIKNELAPGFY